MEYALGYIKDNIIYFSGSFGKNQSHNKFTPLKFPGVPIKIIFTGHRLLVLDDRGFLWTSNYAEEEDEDEENFFTKLDIIEGILDFSSYENIIFTINREDHSISMLASSLQKLHKLHVKDNVHFTKLSCGASVLLAIDTDGNIWIYKYQDHYMYKEFPSKIFVQVTKNIVFTSISSSLHGYGALDFEGNLYVYGHNANGFLAVDKYQYDKLYPLTKINTFGIKFRDIDLGSIHMLLIDTNQNVWGCGIGAYMGLDDIIYQLRLIVGNIKAKSICAGKYNTMIKSTENKLYILGNNTEGQLGLDDINPDIDLLPKELKSIKFYRTKSARK